MTPRPLTAVILACWLLASTSLTGTAQDDSAEPVARQSQIVLYSETKANRPNRSIICTLAGDRVWNRSLHDGNARGIFGRRCQPDKVRHISLVGPIAAGSRLQFFNNRKASTTKPGDSSFAQITLRQGLPAQQTLIIGSFEAFQSNPLFHLASYCNRRSDGRRYCPWRGGDFLDGKVSYIRVLPPRTAEFDEFSIDEDAEGPNLQAEEEPETEG